MPKSRSKRPGYICIWGQTNKESVTDREGVIIACPGCGQKARMIGKAMTPYCSVFYIPLFPQGKGQTFIQCTRCGGKFNGDAAAIRAQLAGSKARMDAEISEKMRLYNANPADADLACEIVELLAGSDRVDEALELATCLTHTHSENANVFVILGRIYLHRNDLAKALEALGQAIERNPSHAAAHYYSAIAFISAKPPKLGEALTFAKQARDYGHPDARALIQSLEQSTRG